MRVTRIYTTLRTAQMSVRADRQNVYPFVRIDAVVNPTGDEPNFYVLADHAPIEGQVIPGAFPTDSPLNSGRRSR